MNQTIIFTCLLALLTFIVLHLLLYCEKKPESFNEKKSVNDVLVQVYDEINNNVNEFNNTNRNINNEISNSFYSMHGKIKQMDENVIQNIGGIKNKFIENENKINNLQYEFASKDDLKKYALSSTLKDQLYNYQQDIKNEFITKQVVESEYVPNSSFKREIEKNKTLFDDTNNQINIVNDKIKTVNNTISTDYAPKAWCYGEFANIKDMRFVKDVQNDMLVNFAKKNDLSNHKNEVNANIKQIENNLNDFKSYTDNTFASTENVKNMLDQSYTPLQYHNAMSRKVNDTLVTLNDALMKSIEYDGDTATYTKLRMLEDQVESNNKDVSDMKVNMDGITQNTIDRNEILLGKFRISGVEPGNNIKVFNKEKTNLSGGITLYDVDTQKINVNNTAAFNGVVNLGTNNLRPVLINGLADVNISEGTFILNDKKANHKIAGNLDVDKIKTNTIQVGNSILDMNYIDKLHDKIESLENKIDYLYTSQK
jgi:hypothetical protein